MLYRPAQVGYRPELSITGRRVMPKQVSRSIAMQPVLKLGDLRLGEPGSIAATPLVLQGGDATTQNRIDRR